MAAPRRLAVASNRADPDDVLRRRDESTDSPEVQRRMAAAKKSAPVHDPVPDIMDGRALSADAVFQMQRLAGNASVTAALSPRTLGDPVSVQREGAAVAAPAFPSAEISVWAGMFSGHRLGQPEDMAGSNWSALPRSRTPPAVLKEVSLKLPAAPPPAPDVYYRPSTVCPSCHDSKDADRALAKRQHDMEVAVLDMERRHGWDAIKEVVGSVETTWNGVVPLVNRYKNAKSDPSLRGAEKAETLAEEGVQDPRANDSFESMAERQQVPATGPAGRRQTVASVLKTAPGPAEMHKLASDATKPSIHQMAQNVQESEAKVAFMVANVRTAMGEYNTALKEVEVAMDQVEKVEATERRDEAQERLNEVMEEKAKAKEVIKGVIEFAEGALKLGVPELEAVDRIEGGSGVAGVLADVIIGAAFAERIRQAQIVVRETTEKLKAIVKKEAADNLAAKMANLDAKDKGRLAAMAGLSPAVIARKSAYDALAAAEQGSGSSAGRHAAGQLAAIPVIEAVISRASEVVSASQIDAKYSVENGIGYTMALNAYPEVMVGFVDCYYQLLGIHADFTSRQKHWQGYLKQVTPVKDTLLGVKHPETSF